MKLGNYQHLKNDVSRGIFVENILHVHMFKCKIEAMAEYNNQKELTASALQTE